MLLLLVLRYLPVASIVDLRLLARQQAEADAAWLKKSKLYGVAAEFATQEALAGRGCQRCGQRRFGVVDALSPLPVPGMDVALALRGRCWAGLRWAACCWAASAASP